MGQRDDVGTAVFVFGILFTIFAFVYMIWSMVAIAVNILALLIVNTFNTITGNYTTVNGLVLTLEEIQTYSDILIAFTVLVCIGCFTAGMIAIFARQQHSPAVALAAGIACSVLCLLRIGDLVCWFVIGSNFYGIGTSSGVGGIIGLLFSALVAALSFWYWRLLIMDPWTAPTQTIVIQSTPMPQPQIVVQESTTVVQAQPMGVAYGQPMVAQPVVYGQPNQPQQQVVYGQPPPGY